MALRMRENERRMREREMFMMAMQAHSHHAHASEEDRILQQVMEESKQNVSDPNQPDVDNMTYEQLLEMADNAGKVSKGLSQAEIDRIKAFMWIEGRTSSDSCSICMDKYLSGVKYKKLPCKHEYHSECINQWLKSQKKCPICSKEVVC